MYRSLFQFVKKRIPRISETEMIALQSGDTSIDKNILKGELSFPRPYDKNIHKFDEHMHKFD